LDFTSSNQIRYHWFNISGFFDDEVEMSVEFRISDLIPATPEEVYSAWFDSEKHAAMTGGSAEVSNQIGGKFSAWDGYISGKNLELNPPLRIMQSWRTTEFAESDPDSLLEITFVTEGNQTRITIRHSELPDHGMQYQQGWVESYFNPMKRYFK
jgi:uncharacterized protein YndB with AHSA1/START domain